MLALAEGSLEAQPHAAALFALIGCGSLLIVVTAVLLVRRPRDGDPPQPKWKAALSSVMGFGMLGVAAFGPSFLTDYGDFLTDLMNAQGDEQRVAYTDAMHRMAAGELPANVQSAVQAHMILNPIPDMLELARTDFPDATNDGRQSLVTFAGQIERAQATAQLAAEGLSARADQGETDVEAGLQLIDTSALRFLEYNPALRPRTLEVQPEVYERVIRNRAELFGRHLRDP